jgi:lysozyme
MVPQSAIDLMKKFEGCKLESYQDSGGIWTIGYGHTKGVTKGMVITQEQADAFLVEEAQNACNQVQELVTVVLTDNKLAALTDFVYNLGIGRLKTSTLLKLINTSEFDAASNQFLLWDHVNGKVLPGLLERRTAERTLFLSI